MVSTFKCRSGIMREKGLRPISHVWLFSSDRLLIILRAGRAGLGNTVAHSRVSFTSSIFDGDGLFNQSIKVSACSGKFIEWCSILIHRCYHNGAFEIVMVWLMMVPFHPLKASCRALTFCASLLQVISGQMSSALCPLVLGTRAPLNTSGLPKKQDTQDHCFASQPVCLVISINSGMARTVDPQESQDGC